ncbi:hypothetical protein F9C07_11753 [Aspergillus flavus]|uniref:Uncharacterized protein n=1 Tax=Aspergillus flavus (strain ATCC 200026 / FGSC A1120 / IAM 13836 / NRRL 3357 / JCM 12722 / SRRC 167) TaxID=332952 RepID=A0A7U2N3T5_ASPFN|nr:hypothetical protein F9C07_11753 [Aspergillus flavus]
MCLAIPRELLKTEIWERPRGLSNLELKNNALGPSFNELGLLFSQPFSQGRVHSLFSSLFYTPFTR